MIAKPHHLVFERLTNQLDILLTSDATITLITGRAQIVLPLPMTAPPHKDEQSELVTKVIQVLRGSPEALQSYSVHIHITNILQLQSVGSRGITQIDIICPTSATKQHLLTIQGKGTITFVGQVAANLTNTKTHVLTIRDLIVLHKLHMQVTEFGLTHVVAPP